jgi:phosphoribosyl-ATP pyrophosphohydrolase
MTFEEICELVRTRKREMPKGRSTTALFEQGAHAIGKKLVEEAAESWMAARYEGREAVAVELSQVLYYVACMMAETGVSNEEVYQHL